MLFYFWLIVNETIGKIRKNLLNRLLEIHFDEGITKMFCAHTHKAHSFHIPPECVTLPVKSLINAAANKNEIVKWNWILGKMHFPAANNPNRSICWKEYFNFRQWIVCVLIKWLTVNCEWLFILKFRCHQLVLLFEINFRLCKICCSFLWHFDPNERTRTLF